MLSCLQDAPEDGGGDNTTPASELGDAAGRALGDVASHGLVEVDSTNIGELALLGQHSGIWSNLCRNISGRFSSDAEKAQLTLETDERKEPKYEYLPM